MPVKENPFILWQNQQDAGVDALEEFVWRNLDNRTPEERLVIIDALRQMKLPVARKFIATVLGTNEWFEENTT